MTPLVSVIVIFLNEEQFLREAVESVLAQTFDDWELLLVDDGSSDAGPDIAREYASRRPGRIRCLEHPGRENLGMSASRNLGVREARGRYLSYLDGDDVWAPAKLARQLELLRANPEARMVYGPLTLWHSWTGLPEDRDRDELYGLHADGLSIEPDTLVRPPDLAAAMIARTALIPSGTLIERAVVEEVGGGVESFRGSYEDAVVLVKVLLRHPAYVSAESWYRYRIHPQSDARSVIRDGRAAEVHRTFLTWVETYLDDENVRDASVRAALRQAWWPHRHPRLHRMRMAVRPLIGAARSAMRRAG